MTIVFQTVFILFISDIGETGKRMYVYNIYTETKKKGQHTNIVLVIIMVIAISAFIIRLTNTQQRNKKQKQHRIETKVNVREDDVRSIVSAMSDEK
jgi:ABC-type Fe3+ transport system permease subunit